jgi:hypothetical protein
MKMMIEKTCNRESEIQRKKNGKNEKQNAEIVMIMK